jgi:hypothetical protein
MNESDKKDWIIIDSELPLNNIDKQIVLIKPIKKIIRKPRPQISKANPINNIIMHITIFCFTLYFVAIIYIPNDITFSYYRLHNIATMA